MTVTRVDAKSLLAIDIGAATTRALLFDAVEGTYRFLAGGTAPTTVNAPVRDVSEGVRLAIDQLQSISGRRLIDEDENLISPTMADGSGVDALVVTYAAGEPLRVFAVGMLKDISLASAHHLVSTTYARLVGSMTLNDHRKTEERIDLIMRLRPDLVVIAGGTDHGATRSVVNLIEPVGLACYLMDKRVRPEILYVGNQKLVDEVQSMLGNLTQLHMADNIRPTLETEQLGPAQARLAEVFRQILARKVQGVQELAMWAGDRVMPRATAFGRVIRFLSQVYDPNKGVLGVELGPSSAAVAASFAGDLRLHVYPELGYGEDLPRAFHLDDLPSIARWIPFEISDDDLYDYLHNHSLYPHALPTTTEELAVDQAIFRELLRLAARRAAADFPPDAAGPRGGLLPWFEPIVAAGEAFTRFATPGQSLLALLDGLQPPGVTTLVVDQNSLTPALGAAAEVNPALTVQVLETGTFLNLGTVISPVGNARPGTPVLHARLVYEDGSEITVEAKQGTVEMLALPNGQVGRLHLQPLQRHDIGMGGPGRGGNLRVIGGALGVVIDARGRPVQLPEDPARRSELLKKWLWVLGG